MKWYKDGKQLTSTKTIHVESKGKSRQLVINNIEKKDAGEYICEVGSEKLIFKIQVAGRTNDNIMMIVTSCIFCLSPLFAFSYLFRRNIPLAKCH